MSYTSTQAQGGNQTILAINTGTSGSPTWTTVGEVTDISQSGKQNKTEDATNLQSTAEEFIPTLKSSGSYKLSISRVSADTGQAAMKAAYDAIPPLVKQFRISLPKTPAQATTGDTYTFLGLVEEYNDLATVNSEKKVMSSATIKVSGPIAEVLGA